MNSLSREEFDVLLERAAISKRLRRELRFVPEEIENWDDLDYLAVMNRSRSEGVVIAVLDTLYVTPFHFQAMKANSTTGRRAAVICDICATWRRGSEISVIRIQNSKDSRIAVSFLCCEDLRCSLHVRDKTNAAILSRTQLRETNTVDTRIERLRSRLRAILDEA